MHRDERLLYHQIHPLKLFVPSLRAS